MSEYVEINPDRLSGQPAVRGRRVFAETVRELAGTEEGRRILREDYDLNDDEIEGVTRWWESNRR